MSQLTHIIGNNKCLDIHEHLKIRNSNIRFTCFDLPREILPNPPERIGNRGYEYIMCKDYDSKRFFVHNGRDDYISYKLTEEQWDLLIDFLDNTTEDLRIWDLTWKVSRIDGKLFFG